MWLVVNFISQTISTLILRCRKVTPMSRFRDFVAGETKIVNFLFICNNYFWVSLGRQQTPSEWTKAQLWQGEQKLKESSFI